MALHQLSKHFFYIYDFYDNCVQTVFIPLHLAANNLLCKFSEYVLGDVSIVTSSTYLCVYICQYSVCVCLSVQ